MMECVESLLTLEMSPTNVWQKALLRKMPPTGEGQNRAGQHSVCSYVDIGSKAKKAREQLNGMKICGGEYTEMMRKDLLRPRNTHIKKLSPSHD